MPHIDILSAYLICGVSSLVGAAMLGMSDASDERMRSALQASRGGMFVMGVGLLPAGLGPGAAHPAAQLSITAGVLAGVALLAQGLGHLDRRVLPSWALAAVLMLSVLAPTLALTVGTRALGITFVAALAMLCTMAAWMTRAFLLRPRDAIERVFGLTLAGTALSGWIRLAFTLAHDGPVATHFMDVPASLGFVFAALYGVIPMVVATPMLTLAKARLSRQLHQRASTDGLTGTMTRRALRELAPALVARQRAAQREVAVLMLDLDPFKAINDSHGHRTGDAALQLIAAILGELLRGDAMAARYGGEEFVALVPVDDPATARRVAERLRCAIGEADWRGRLGLERPLTVSIGVALVGPRETLEAALQRADEALYRAKREGRDQCQFSLSIA